MGKATGCSLSSRNKKLSREEHPPHRWRERLENNEITYPSLVPSQWGLSGRNWWGYCKSKTEHNHNDNKVHKFPASVRVEARGEILKFWLYEPPCSSTKSLNGNKNCSQLNGTSSRTTFTSEYLWPLCWRKCRKLAANLSKYVLCSVQRWSQDLSMGG